MEPLDQGKAITEGKIFQRWGKPTDRGKADYAESSMSHNTGVARLWNDLMRDVQVDGEFKCRTKLSKLRLISDNLTVSQCVPPFYGKLIMTTHMSWSV